MTEEPLRQTAADMTTVLRSVLTPVLKGRLENHSIDELALALDLARAGIAMSRYQPRWLLTLDSACAKMQKPLSKALRLRALHSALKSKKLPVQLQESGLVIQRLAAQRRKESMQDWLDWLSSSKGLSCHENLETALVQGQKSKSFVLAEKQMTDCLTRDKERLSKCSQKLLNRSCWRHIKSLGKAARRQQLSHKFVNLLGKELDAGELDLEIKNYQSALIARRTAKWLRQQLPQGELSASEAAAIGALWQQQYTESQRLELALLVRVDAEPPDNQQLQLRERPSLPLQLRFGNKTTA